jgi:hypothetical protein
MDEREAVARGDFSMRARLVNRRRAVTLAPNWRQLVTLMSAAKTGMTTVAGMSSRLA